MQPITLAIKGAITPAAWTKFGSKGTPDKKAFTNPIRNYYLTNAICRSSDTMQACSREFISQTEEYMEAAE